MQPCRYEVILPNGNFCTINAISPVGAVASISKAARHEWERHIDGSYTITARAGDGERLETYTVLKG